MKTNGPTRVFINCPFDEKYVPQFVALLSTIICSGYRPTCVLELPAAKQRLQRIRNLIADSGASFHDLSRVEGARFNMPFEAGLAFAHSASTSAHSIFFMESKRFRLQKTLSDLNGFDPLIHNGNVSGMVHRVLDALSPEQNRPSAKTVIRISRVVLAAIRRLLRTNELDELFSTRGFKVAVAVASQAAADARIIARIARAQSR